VARINHAMALRVAMATSDRVSPVARGLADARHGWPCPCHPLHSRGSATPKSLCIQSHWLRFSERGPIGARLTLGEIPVSLTSAIPQNAVLHSAAKDCPGSQNVAGITLVARPFIRAAQSAATLCGDGLLEPDCRHLLERTPAAVGSSPAAMSHRKNVFMVLPPCFFFVVKREGLFDLRLTANMHYRVPERNVPAPFLMCFSSQPRGGSVSFCPPNRKFQTEFTNDFRACSAIKAFSVLAPTFRDDSRAWHFRLRAAMALRRFLLASGFLFLGALLEKMDTTKRP